ncbi:hypothetical protein M8C21_014358 [Ambrosia artemisiifolia]|uniref:18S pre-ribosomal assembly protein gar2-like protein n=1 Tax=Ambrosia artemisiifolia TaxID=4212 RepID=A0AAD5BMU9_AMBAR|nr:hypothetical protein M8C21_014358 [Ambrosia artemisiifolia]
MKESPGRYINPFLSDEENDKVNCITNLDDGMFEKSLEPSNVRSESLEKAKEVYIDKNVTCYEENGYNVVKDICVDEGLSNEEMVKCDKEQHELSCSPVVGDGDKHDDMIKDDIDTQLKSSMLEDCCKNSCLSSVTEDDNVPSSHASDKIELFVESNIRPDNSTQNGEEELDSSSNLLNDSIRVLSEDKLNSSSNLVNNSISVLEAADNSVNGVNQQLSEQQSTGSEPNEPRPTSHTFDIPNEIKTEEITNSDSDDVKPSTASGSHELLLNTESPPNHLDMASNNILAAPRGGGETSFSMAGSVSGHITFLGPITSAGSISHRSDGSNTSVRSFAFPILQNEWNSSPVRMAKADPRQSRKHRGWRQALLCCRF